MSHINQTTPRLLTVNQFAEEHKFVTSAGLRFIIFNENSNGAKKAIKRIGRKVLIDEAAFFQWIEEQNEVNHA